MADPALHERRRYSGVVIQHPSLTDFQSLRSSLQQRVGSPRRVKAAKAPWGLERFEFYAGRNLYPEHRVVNLEARRRKHGFAHDMYFASRPGRGATGPPTVLVASPYMRLLSQLLRLLRSNLPGPAPQYLSVNMAATYAALSRGVEGVATTKVTWQMLGEPGLELVSLAGRNPLHSELHAALSAIAAPYSLRVDVDGDDEQHCRINLDRHGNLWWYLASEKRMALPLMLIDTLERFDVLKKTRTVPLERAEGTDDL